MMPLDELGWGSDLQQWWDDNADSAWRPARVVTGTGAMCTVRDETASVLAEPVRRLPGGTPVVGDWVAIDEANFIHARVDRRTCVTRRSPGGGAQAVAANVDVVFIVTALDDDFSLRRIERYVAVVWSSGAQPVCLLSKADLVSPEDAEARISEVMAIAPGVDVHAVSNLDNAESSAENSAENSAEDSHSAGRQSAEALVRQYCGRGRTVALIGSSGVGKSTLVNALLGEERQATGAVREADSKGRHTTTRRELLPMPNGGGLVIDTPGMREIGLWDAADGVAQTFSDVLAAAEGCRFRDCEHESEPGCGVREAVEAGELETARVESYKRLLREDAFEARKTDPTQAGRSKRRWKAINKQQRAHYRDHDKY